MKKLLENFKIFVTVDLTQYDAAAVQTTTTNNTGNSLSAEMKTFYDGVLLDEAQPKLVHDQFGQDKPIPAGKGKTIEFRKFDSLPKATTAITEGVVPDGNTLNVTTKTATIGQYGSFIKMSDMLEMTTIDPIVAEATKALGSQAGRTLDTITRDIINAGTNVFYSKKDVSGTATAVTARTGLDLTATLKVSDILDAATFLEAQNAETIDGDYVAIIHPYNKRQIMDDDDFKDWHKYTNAEAMYNGEIGKIGNVRFVVTTEAKIWKDSTCPSYTESSATKYMAVYSTLVIGANAYGKSSLENGGLQTVVKPLGYKDELNLVSSVGWKATKTAVILNDLYLARIESCCPNSKTISVN